MPNPIEKAATSAGGALTHKVGPLPVWAWGGVAVVGGVAVYFIFFRNAGGTTTGSTAGTGAPPSTSGSGGGGGSTTPPTVTPPTTTPPAVTMTNPQWLAAAIPEVARRLGIGSDRVRLYLTEYLSGTAPVGSSSASSAFQQVVDTALQAIGQPPNAVQFPNPNTNPFSSNATWFENARGFLGTVSGGVILELQALFSGNTTSISQEAATALENARGVIGAEPNAINYTIRAPAALVSLETIAGFLADAAGISAGGTDIRQPAVYQGVYRRWFPNLSGGQIEYLNQVLRNLYAQYGDKWPTPDVIQRAVIQAIQSGTELPLPGGSTPPPPSGGAPPPSGGGGSQLPAGWLFQPGGGGNWIWNPISGEIKVPSWVDAGWGVGVTPPGGWAGHH